MKHSFRAIFLFTCLLPLCQVVSADASFILIENKSSPAPKAYTLFSQHLLKILPTIEVVDISGLSQMPTVEPTIIIAQGTRTCGDVIAKVQDSAKILCLFISKHEFQQLISDANSTSGRFHALVIDQPLERYLRLIRRLNPKAASIGIIYSPRFRHYVDDLTHANKTFRFKIHPVHAEDDNAIGSALFNLGSNVEFLLSLPDPVIYNRYTARNILLTSFRSKIPVISFSDSYVRAGASAAVYTSPEQFSEQAKDILNSLASGLATPPVVHPSNYTVSINERVAFHLGLQSVDPALIELDTPEVDQP